MRKIFLIILTVFLWLFGYAQFPITQNLGAPSTLVLNRGGFKSDSALVIPSYSDTVRANQSLGKTYPGNIIRVGNVIYIRNSTATGWVLVGTGGGGGGSFDTVYAKYPIRVDTTGVKDTLYLAQPFLDSVYNNSPGFLDGLVSTGGISLVDTSALIQANIVWKRNGSVITQNTSSLIPIPRADSLNYRVDLIYINLANTIVRLAGIQDTANAVAPAIPSGGILITYVNVYGSSRIVNQTASVYQRTGVLFVDLNSGQITADSTRLAWNQSNGSLIIGNQAANSNPSAILQLTSNNKGFLMPTMSAALRNGISSPANGLMVYDTDSSALFYYDNTQWKKLINSFNVPTLQQVTTAGDTTSNEMKFRADGYTGRYTRVSINPNDNYSLRLRYDKNGVIDSSMFDAGGIISYYYDGLGGQNISNFQLNNNTTVGISQSNVKMPVTELGNVPSLPYRVLALSVNNNFADSAGNISFTSSPTTLQQAFEADSTSIPTIAVRQNDFRIIGQSNDFSGGLVINGGGTPQLYLINTTNGTSGAQIIDSDGNQTLITGKSSDSSTHKQEIKNNKITFRGVYGLLNDSTKTRVGIGTDFPDTVLHVFGSPKFETDSAQAGYVWTSQDNTGQGEWRAATTGGGGGGGSSINYYLNGSVNQGTFGGDTYYELSQTPILGAGTNFTRLNSAGNGYIASFITDVGDPNIINIPGGNWGLEFYFQSNLAGGSPRFYGEVYKYDGTTFTLIASGSTNPEAITNGTTVDQYFTSIPVPQTTLLSSDRLAVRVYVITGGRNITLHTEDNNLSEVLTSINIPAWKTSGNADVNAGQFIGSTNNASLRFRTNNTERMVLDSIGGMQMASVANNGTLTNALQLANTNNRSFFNISTGPNVTNLTLKANNNSVTDSMVISDSGLIQPRTNSGLWLSGRTTGTFNIMASRCASCIGTASIFAANIAGSAPIFNVLGTGQVSIGAQDPASTAALDITATSRGLLIPRMTTSTRNSIVTPAQGLMVWNTDDTTLNQFSGNTWRGLVGYNPSGTINYTAPTQTGSNANSILDLTQTWNTTGTPTAFKINVINTASNANSLILDLQSGGTSVFKVARNGGVATINSAIITVIQGVNTFETNANSLTATSGNNPIILSRRTFNPTSGTAETTGFAFQGTINQTGGANGITRGLHINPTLTAAADFRAIETTAGQLRMADAYGSGSGSLARSLLDLSQTWNTTGNPAAIKLNVTNTASGSTSSLMDLQVGGTSYFNVDKGAKITQFATNTAAGTTGNQTINRPTGTVNIAAAGTTVTVTNNLVTANSLVFAVIRTDDLTATIKNVVPGAGTFTINLNAAATAETSIGFWVIN